MWILWKMRFQKCEFCEKWHFTIVNFVKNEVSKMWILWKMRFQKGEFCENWDFRKVNFVKIEISIKLILWKLGLSICEFLDKMRIFAPVRIINQKVKKAMIYTLVLVIDMCKKLTSLYSNDLLQNCAMNGDVLFLGLSSAFLPL